VSLPLIGLCHRLVPDWHDRIRDHGPAARLFGVGLTIGNLTGGRLADWRLIPSVICSYAGVVLVLAAFAYTSHFAVPAIATVVVWGPLGFALISPLQTWVVDTANDAPNLASTMNQSAFNLGD
jgi:DHA1 family inner membrane transport protein